MEYVIYKIVITDKPEFLYIGHTQNFNNRKHYHKCGCTTNINRLLYKSINENGGWDNCKMILIDNLIGSKIDARIRENYLYETLKPNLNSISPFTTCEERKEKNKIYRENNHEFILEKKKEYYYNHKEEDNKRSKEYRETHMEELKEYKKEWYEANKERLQEKNNEKIKCECGIEYTRANRIRHFKSKRHLDLIDKHTT